MADDLLAAVAAVESLESRIEKAGYPRGLAAEMRHRRSELAHRAVVARNRARRDARLHRHTPV
jgi:hypothetical protein